MVEGRVKPVVCIEAYCSENGALPEARATEGEKSVDRG